MVSFWIRSTWLGNVAVRRPLGLLGSTLVSSFALVGSFALQGCGGSGVDPRVAAISGLDAERAQGEPVYMANCQKCHGTDGKGAGGSVKLDVAKVAADSQAEARVIEQILSGSDEMPSFAKLSDQQIADVVRYLGTIN
jgi:mono/diheme cytochrome c family protein